MQFGLLGPLVATDDGGQPIALPTGKPRMVLAVLLLSPNAVVRIHRLIDAVWEEEPPKTARQTIQYFVHKLRKALATNGQSGEEVLTTEAGGYRLEVAPENLDVIRFERLVARGRAESNAGQSSAAARTFATALALWRGPALADIASASFAQPDIVRLEELRVAA